MNMLHARAFRETVGWGFLLWLTGYLLGFMFFPFVSTDLLGWAIAPIGAALTVWVLVRKIRRSPLTGYLRLSVVWTLMAIVLDFVFLVQLLHPTDGYYKADVYLYYVLTFVLPLAVGWWQQRLGQKRKP